MAAIFYPGRSRFAAAILVATMVVDVDHLLAAPVYDPERCSIGFHPLHTAPALAGYALLFLGPVWIRRRARGPGAERVLRAVHLAGLGLLLHMALDFGDCL